MRTQVKARLVVLSCSGRLLPMTWQLPQVVTVIVKRHRPSMSIGPLAEESHDLVNDLLSSMGCQGSS
jgi:hypothetical protein